MSDPKVTYRQDAKGIAALEIADDAGPVIVIESNGDVTVKRGPFDEAGRLFWEAVRHTGVTYRERILNLEQAVIALSTDPYKAAVRSGGHEIWQGLTREQRGRMTHMDVGSVLEQIEKIATRSTQ